MSVFPTSILLLAALIAVPLRSQADPPLDSVRQLMINGEADHAIRALNAMDVSSSDAHNLLCRIHYSEERWDAAVNECERAARLDPNNSEKQLWLGRAYGEKAEHSSWITAIGLAKKTHVAFERAVQLDPNNVSAHSDLSEYYIEAPGFLGGGIDKAAQQANVVEKIEPATALWIRARIAEHDKRNDEAEQYYKKAIQIGKDHPRRLFDLASFYRRVSRYDDLQRTIEQASKLDTENDSTLVDSASLLLRVGRDYDLAASMLRRYIEHGTHSEEAPVFKAQYLLGQVLEKMGNTEAAKVAYKSAHDAASEFAPAAAAVKRLGA